MYTDVNVAALFSVPKLAVGVVGPQRAEYLPKCLPFSKYSKMVIWVVARAAEILPNGLPLKAHDSVLQ